MANTTDTMTPEEILRGIINGTLTELEDDGVTAIGARKFHNRTALTRVSFPNFNGSIGEYAFNGCTNLTSANFPNVTSIGAYAFNNCSNLSSFNMGSSNITGVGTYAFNGCSNISGSLDLSKATSMGGYAFQNATFSSINMPKLSVIQSHGFRGCKAQYINTGTATFSSNGTNMFTDCVNLRGFAQHRTGYTTNDYFNGAVFNGCSNLEYIDLGTQLRGGSLVSGCTKIKMIICRAGDVRALGSVGSVTSGTPFAESGTGGTLYCRKSLIATYKAATNWVTILAYPNNMVLPIEGSYYQMYFADDTEVSGASYSDPKYFMENWGLSYTNNIIWTSKSNARGCCIALRGDHPIKLNAADGGETHIYPIEIETGKTGITITSDSLDLDINEVYWDGTDWKRTGGSGWLLQSSSSSHSYTFTGSNTTHIYVNARVAGDTGDEGTVTQAMMDAITFAWND